MDRYQSVCDPGDGLPSADRSSFLMHIEFLVQGVHQPDINKNEDDEHIDRSLLGEPKPKSEPADPDPIQRVGHQDPEDVRDEEPDREKEKEVPKVGVPVIPAVVLRHNVPERCCGVRKEERNGESPAQCKNIRRTMQLKVFPACCGEVVVDYGSAVAVLLVVALPFAPAHPVLAHPADPAFLAVVFPRVVAPLVGPAFRAVVVPPAAAASAEAVVLLVVAVAEPGSLQPVSGVCPCVDP